MMNTLTVEFVIKWRRRNNRTQPRVNLSCVLSAWRTRVRPTRVLQGGDDPRGAGGGSERLGQGFHLQYGQTWFLRPASLASLELFLQRALSFADSEVTDQMRGLPAARGQPQTLKPGRETLRNMLDCRKGIIKAYRLSSLLPRDGHYLTHELLGPCLLEQKLPKEVSKLGLGGLHLLMPGSMAQRTPQTCFLWPPPACPFTLKNKWCVSSSLENLEFLGSLNPCSLEAAVSGQ